MQEQRHAEIGDDDAHGDHDGSEGEPAGEIGDEQEQGAGRRGERQQRAMIASDQHARDVRRDEAYERDHAGEADDGGGGDTAAAVTTMRVRVTGKPSEAATSSPPAANALSAQACACSTGRMMPTSTPLIATSSQVEPLSEPNVHWMMAANCCSVATNCTVAVNAPKKR